jgi:hypothetical protein
LAGAHHTSSTQFLEARTLPGQTPLHSGVFLRLKATKGPHSRAVTGVVVTRGGEVRVRKLIALIMVALLALTVALAAVGCGKKAEDETPPPAADQGTMANPDSMTMDSTGMDTTMHH